MPSAGDLKWRLHCQSREAVSDGYGNRQGGEWITRFTVPAAMVPKMGGEQVMASRLDGLQPYVVSVRQESRTRQITTAWRLVDARDETRIFSISAIIDPDGRRLWLDILATQGHPG